MATPIGIGRETFWSNLLAGQCGIGPVESFDTSKYKVHRGVEIKGFSARDYVLTLAAAGIGRASQLAIAAARLAISDAGIELSAFDPETLGVTMGTISGEPKEVERFNDYYLSQELDQIGPEFIESYPCHQIAAHIANELNFAGVNTMIPTACAAGNFAIAHAFEVLQSGRADLMLAGRADAFSRITFTGFAVLGAIAPEICQPFDRNRKGMIPGESAGILVLEPLDDAIARGARIYAEITGYGLACDAHHMTAAHPNGDGAVAAMEQALRESSLPPRGGELHQRSRHRDANE